MAGRTGRGQKGGRVLVQTFDPEHPAIDFATRHDFIGFAKSELPRREEFNYPPYGHLARIVVRSEIESKAEQMADRIADAIQKSNDSVSGDIRILGPTPAPAEKLRGKFRFHMLLFSDQPGLLQDVVGRTEQGIKPIEGIQWIVDIDPQDML